MPSDHSQSELPSEDVEDDKHPTKEFSPEQPSNEHPFPPLVKQQKIDEVKADDEIKTVDSEHELETDEQPEETTKETKDDVDKAESDKTKQRNFSEGIFFVYMQLLLCCFYCYCCYRCLFACSV